MTKILVIEDETQTRGIFMNCLSFEGFCTLEAESGAVGLKLAQSQQPDLIVCDIMMPDMDGYQVLSTLRQHPSTAAIPFIFLTAKVTMTDLRQGMEFGADDYLTKPCTVEQFLAAITTRLKRQESLKAHFGQALVGPEEPDSLDAPELTPAADSGIFPSCPRLSKMFAFIEAHYSEAIGLGDVAEAVGYSPAYLTNLSQALTGYSVKRWITERRMFQARQLLQETNQPIRQIAETVGYPDVGYFTRQFRQLHGNPPQNWRNSTRLRSA
ncbi:MAG: response regulator [Leptolyngbyaceae cyanobacterium bins.59]|nr:response regulator [Leptolyngbyaceae cyanobacterium bins.59]